MLQIENGSATPHDVKALIEEPVHLGPMDRDAAYPTTSPSARSEEIHAEVDEMLSLPCMVPNSEICTGPKVFFFFLPVKL